MRKSLMMSKKNYMLVVQIWAIVEFALACKKQKDSRKEGRLSKSNL